MRKAAIFAVNKWTTWCKLDDAHIFESQGIVDRVTQLKRFISLICTVAWGFNFVLLIERSWNCLFYHSICMFVKNNKLVFKFFKYTYIRDFIFQWVAWSCLKTLLERKSLIGVYQESWHKIQKSYSEKNLMSLNGVLFSLALTGCFFTLRL